jgi:secreted trypsin-like serine protease
MTKHPRFRRVFNCERLEPRCMLSSLAGADDGEFHAIIVAGDPTSDSPALRVDPNTTTSPFAGVGSLQITASSGTYICTGTPIDATHVLTAGHCVDIDNNGKPDVSAVTFNLNYGGDLTSQISAVAWETHPDFRGFARPSVNDDLAVITLGQALPSGVPFYSPVSSDMVAGQTHLYLVGYGRSGDGVNGYTTGASFTIKRDGENMVDAFYGQDDARKPSANEVFRFDFDGPNSSTNVMGGPTLGNATETTLGGGDSGGPSFVLAGGVYYLAGVNTFTQGTTAPKFGSLGGGINVFPYKSWILGPHPTTNPSGGGKGGPQANKVNESVIVGVLVREDNAASLSASASLVAAPADESLSSTLTVGPSQSSSNLISAAPALIVAANTASAEFAGRPGRVSTLAGKEGHKTIGEESRASEDWNSSTVDAVLEGWTSGSNGPV